MKRVLGALAVAGTLLLASCTATDSTRGDSEAGGSGESVSLEQVEASAPLDVPSALDNRTHEDFPASLNDPSSLRSGGPPPDGIPAIDDPKFQRAESVDLLSADESVLSFTLDGETRAYPI